MGEEEKSRFEKEITKQLGYIKNVNKDILDNILFQPFEGTPDNPAPILKGNAETIEYIVKLQNTVREQSKEIELREKKIEEIVDDYEEQIKEKNEKIFNLECERESLWNTLEEEF